MIELVRRYFKNGTNGHIRGPQGVICYTIELPWLNNTRRISCIPEGEYEIVPFKSKKHGDVYTLKGVPGRSAILIHAANIAQKELNGCIAPVSNLTGEGRGYHSRAAMSKLFDIIKKYNITKIKIMSE